MTDLVEKVRDYLNLLDEGRAWKKRSPWPRRHLLEQAERALREAASPEIEERERAELARLKEKYERSSS